MDTSARPLGAIIGEGLRSVRQLHNLNQDDIATAARACGLRWDRATVAGVETGRRRLDIGEYLLLPVILREALGVEVDVAALVPETSTVRFGSRVCSGSAVRALIRSELAGFDPKELPTPGTKEHSLVVEDAVHAHRAENLKLGATGAPANGRLSAAQQIWPGAKQRDLVKAEMDSDKLVERRAAERLGVSSFEVALAARRLWKRSMTEERDRRITASEGASRASVRALAGHVTRQLTEELRRVLTRAKEN